MRRLMAGGKSESDAEQLVDTVDHERSDFIQKYFHVHWPDSSAYHAMINTSIGERAVIHTILDLMKTLDATASPLVATLA